MLDFINIEELDERDPQDIDERIIENSIVSNVKNFILTFGKDFTFMGNQVHIDKFGSPFLLYLPSTLTEEASLPLPLT